MFADLLNVLFGCTHRSTTFPLTVPVTRAGASRGRAGLKTYVACLDCGKEFPYDWQEMRIVSPDASEDATRGHAVAGVPRHAGSFLTIK